MHPNANSYFSRRRHRPELLDRPNIPAADIARNLEELMLINRLLGGHRVTMNGFSALAGSRKKISVAELGCGGGDNLLAIQELAGKQGIDLQCTGIDLNADCIRFAQAAAWKKAPEWKTCDYRLAEFRTRPDILFASLFCHHFPDDELVGLFRWMQQQAGLGFFVNDLHRHPVAYYAIRVLTALFSRSYLVKHDAPRSVLNGFKRKELQAILEKAGITRYRIQWQWAFRWLIIVPS
jgi:SAM-dependent methyltransferase